VRIALAKWKKAHQKKQVLKERAMDKAAKVAMKKYI
jgi:tmRNA-binding protein